MENYNVTKVTETIDVREAMAITGVHHSSDTDLMQAFLQNGSKANQKETAKALLSQVPLKGICDFSVSEWISIGLTEKKAVAISSIIELTKRSMKAKSELAEQVFGSDSLAARLCGQYGHHKQEHFVAIYLDVQNRIIEERVLFVGTVNRSIADPKVIAHHAVKNLATSVIICHNHPSGSTKPSNNDNKLTGQLNEALKLLNVVLLDHIIVTASHGYYSYREESNILYSA